MKYNQEVSIIEKIAFLHEGEYCLRITNKNLAKSEFTNFLPN